LDTGYPMSPATYPEAERATPLPPYSVLLRVGFTWPASHLTAGALLPHRSTLTQHCWAVYISVALSLGLPPLGVTQHPALWSPDFPHAPLFSFWYARSPGLLASNYSLLELYNYNTILLWLQIRNQIHHSWQWPSALLHPAPQAAP